MDEVITDIRGTRHEVAIDESFHDWRTGAGEMQAVCACGWRDQFPFTPRGEAFARLKLQYRAADHI